MSSIEASGSINGLRTTLGPAPGPHWAVRRDHVSSGLQTEWKCSEPRGVHVTAAAEPSIRTNSPSTTCRHSKVLLSQLCLLRVNEKSRLIFKLRPNRTSGYPNRADRETEALTHSPHSRRWHGALWHCKHTQSENNLMFCCSRGPNCDPDPLLQHSETWHMNYYVLLLTFFMVLCWFCSEKPHPDSVSPELHQQWFCFSYIIGPVEDAGGRLWSGLFVFIIFGFWLICSTGDESGCMRR